MRFSAICSISQKAAVEALNGDQTVVAEMVEVFRGRRDHIVERMRAIPGVTCRVPDGAFYVFPNMTAFYDRLPEDGSDAHPSVRLSAYLLDQAHAAVVPGIAFGPGAHIRISYATRNAELDQRLDGIQQALARL